MLYFYIKVDGFIIKIIYISVFKFYLRVLIESFIMKISEEIGF